MEAPADVLVAYVKVEVPVVLLERSREVEYLSEPDTDCIAEDIAGIEVSSVAVDARLCDIAPADVLVNMSLCDVSVGTALDRR